jgi:hypothetical protein
MERVILATSSLAVGESLSMSRWLVLAVTAALAVGCGGEDIPTLVPVSGTVSMDGKPIAGASVEFIPLDPKQPQTAGGATTDQSGKYIAMYRGNPGLSPGKYKVNVQKAASPDSSKTAGGIEKDPYMAKLSADAGKVETKVRKEIKAELNRVVPDAGGVVDLELKGDASKK